MDPGKPPPALGALIAAILCLTVLSMLFSGAESAFLSLNKLRLRMGILKQDPRARRVAALLKHRDRLINTFLIGNTLANLGLTSLVTLGAVALWGPSGVGIAALGSTVFLLVFGEITPKSIAARFPEAVAFALSPVVAFFAALFSPGARLFAFLARRIAALGGIALDGGTGAFSKDEINTIIDISKEAGILEAQGTDMMHRVFVFRDQAAHRVMTPRRRMVTVQPGASYADVLALARKTGFWRFPVHSGNVDDIAGVLYLNDLVPYADSHGDFAVKKAMRPAVHIPGSKKVSAAQRILRESGQDVGIVMDEYGGTWGLITTADISAVIFGRGAP
jgi:CBS domain containing-hemolysin-like protein